MERSDGGQRLVDIDEVSRLVDERRRAATDRPIVAQSARNRFAGVITRIEADRVAAVVEVIAGPHRLVSLMTAEAVADMGLKVGDEAVCVVKATNVPSRSRRRGSHESMRSDGRIRAFALVLAACSTAVGQLLSAAAPASQANTAHRPPWPRHPEQGRARDLRCCVAQGALTRQARVRGLPPRRTCASTDASSALETKIEQGAPASVFLSADTTNPRSRTGLTTGPPVNFAKNILTVIVPIMNPAKIRRRRTSRSRPSIIAAGVVLITGYANMLVANLAKHPGYPANYVAAYNATSCPRKTTSRPSWLLESVSATPSPMSPTPRRPRRSRRSTSCPPRTSRRRMPGSCRRCRQHVGCQTS
jgi:molybdopterin-binding protein